MNKKISLLFVICILVVMLIMQSVTVCAVTHDGSVSSIAQLEKPVVSIEKTTWAENESITISWTPCNNVSYYMLMAYNESLSSAFPLVMTKDTCYPLELSEGKYYIEVSAILADEDGNTLETKTADLIYVVVEAEKPVVSIPKTTWAENESITISWVPCSNVSYYSLIAYDERYSSALPIGMTVDTSFPLELPEGKYYIEVSAILADEHGNTLETKTADHVYVVVEAEKPVVSIEKTTWTEAEIVTISWVPCSNVSYYSLIAYDEKYSSAMPIGMTVGTSFPLELPKGKYYIEVSAILADEYGNTLETKTADHVYVVVEAEKPVISIEKTTWAESEDVFFAWKLCQNADSYDISVYDKNRGEVVAQGWTDENNYQMHLPKGDYQISVTGVVTDDEGSTIEVKGTDTIDITVEKPKNPATYTESYVMGNTRYVDVTVYSVDGDCQVILALYDGLKLVEMQYQPYTGKSDQIFFTPTQDYTSAKVMLWDNLNSMQYLCEFEQID